MLNHIIYIIRGRVCVWNNSRILLLQNNSYTVAIFYWNGQTEILSTIFLYSNVIHFQVTRSRYIWKLCTPNASHRSQRWRHDWAWSGTWLMTSWQDPTSFWPGLTRVHFIPCIEWRWAISSRAGGRAWWVWRCTSCRWLSRLRCSAASTCTTGARRRTDCSNQPWRKPYNS